MSTSVASRALPLLASLGALASLAVPSGAAYACTPEAASRWMPQRSWPSSCEPDAFVDGLVVLDGDAIPSYALGGDGELRVNVARVVDGSPVEVFEGKVSYPDGTSALFQSDRPLAPATDYVITAYRAAIDGTPIGDKFTSAFTTGTRTLGPLAMAGEPTLSYEESDRKRHSCTSDACGQQHCSTSDELVHVRSLRVAVPELTGGLDAKPYRVKAELVATFVAGQAPAVATTDTAATQADKRSFFVLDLPALPAEAEGCVTVHVEDVAGHTLASTPVCMKFDADGAELAAEPLGDGGQIKIVTSAPSDEAEDLEQFELSSSTDAVTTAPEVDTASAGGCTIGRTGGGNASTLGWLGLALTLARLRPRRRARQDRTLS